ncbi:MAG: Spy0128 family protein [Suipraeoptans sp.]
MYTNKAKRVLRPVGLLLVMIMITALFGGIPMPVSADPGDTYSGNSGSTSTTPYSLTNDNDPTDVIGTFCASKVTMGIGKESYVRTDAYTNAELADIADIMGVSQGALLDIVYAITEMESNYGSNGVFSRDYANKSFPTETLSRSLGYNLTQNLIWYRQYQDDPSAFEDPEVTFTNAEQNYFYNAAGTFTALDISDKYALDIEVPAGYVQGADGVYTGEANDAGLIGPFKITIDSMSAQSLIELNNYGPNKDQIPTFTVSTDRAGTASIYDAGDGMGNRITEVTYGQEFWLRGSSDVAQTLTVGSVGTIITGIEKVSMFADELAQPQFAVIYEKFEGFQVTYSFVTDGLKKEVTEFNGTDISGSYDKHIQVDNGEQALFKVDVEAPDSYGRNLFIGDSTKRNADGYLEIYTPEQVIKALTIEGAYNSWVTDKYILMNNIDMTDYFIEYDVSWPRISLMEGGIFDGNGYTIHGINDRNKNASSANGFFENVAGGSIVKNLALSGLDLIKGSNVGGIAGTISDSTIQNCIVSGNISIGSLSTATGQVVMKLAGIVAAVEGNVTIENCSVDGLNLTVYNIGTNSSAYIGGIIGGYRSSVDADVTINQCSVNNLTISRGHTHDSAAGISGDPFGTNMAACTSITNCYVSNLNILENGMPPTYACYLGSVYASGMSSMTPPISDSDFTALSYLVENYRVDGTVEIANSSYGSPSGPYGATISITDRNDSSAVWTYCPYDSWLVDSYDGSIMTPDKLLDANLNPLGASDDLIFIQMEQDDVYTFYLLTEELSPGTYLNEVRLSTGEYDYSTVIVNDDKFYIDVRKYSEEIRNPLTGSQFQIWKYDDYNSRYSGTSSLVATITPENANSRVEITEKGYYYLIESVTPTDFVADTTIYYFEFTGNDILFSNGTSGWKNSFSYEAGEKELTLVLENINQPEVPMIVSNPIRVRKQVTGSPDVSATFTFVLEGEDSGTPMPEGSTGNRKEVTVTGNGTASFGSVTYDAAGVYTYTISEKKESVYGYTYDEAIYTLVVTVAERAGSSPYTNYLYIESSNLYKDDSTVPESGSIAVFTNIYSDDVTPEIEAGKTLNGVNYTGTEFEFELFTGYGGTEVLIDTQTSVTGGTFAFDTSSIKLTETGTYTYYIREKAYSGSGYQIDTTVYRVVVTVGKSNGRLTIEDTKYYNAETDIEITTGVKFENKTVVTPQISAIKTLNGNLYEGSLFEFELLKDLNGIEPAIDTQTSVSGGTVTFDTSSIKLTEAGTHTYYIREKVYSGSGVQIDTTIYRVEVTVVNNAGVLSISSIRYYNNTTNELVTGIPTFANKSEATPEIEARKTLNGSNYDGALFRFELYTDDGVDENVIDTQGTVTVGVIKFNTSSIKFTAAGTQTYYIREMSYTGNGIQIDTTIYKVVVTAVNTGGVISIDSVKYYDLNDQEVTGGVPVFKNVTELTPEIEARKTLDGEDYNSAFYGGVLFEFELFEDYGLLETSISTQTSVTGGVISFDTSTIKLSTEGTYEYYIREKSYTGTGVVIDSTVYKVKIVVTNTSGVLAIDSVKYYDADTDIEIDEIPTFENESSVEIVVVKNWTDESNAELDPGTDLIESITVELKYKNDSGDFVSFSPKKTLVLTKADNWTGKFTNLEKYDADGNEIEYTVSEIEVKYADGITEAQKPSFDVIVGDPEDITSGQQITITNKFKGKIIIKKQDDDGKDIEGVEFTLQAAEIAGDGIWSVKSGGLTIVKETQSDGSAIFDNLPTGNYLLTETKGKEGLSLLAEPIQITIPYNGNGTNNTPDIPGIDESGGDIYYYSLTYVIRNGSLFDMPESGGGGILKLYSLGLLFLLLGAAYGLIFLRRKRVILSN